jgi:hypothetical protein
MFVGLVPVNALDMYEINMQNTVFPTNITLFHPAIVEI